MTPPVLVVDDHEDFRSSLAAWIGDELHLPVRLASDGLDAQRFFTDPAQPAPFVVLLDLEMPGLDGPGLFAWLRAHAQPMPRVVLVSASRSLPRVAAELEVDGYLPKPVDLSGLRAALGLS
ncbi:MAG: response regulator [Planctomycetes bacterium]|nr:response regulator [Planctomycetota bacterium]